MILIGYLIDSDFSIGTPVYAERKSNSLEKSRTLYLSDSDKNRQVQQFCPFELTSIECFELILIKTREQVKVRIGETQPYIIRTLDDETIVFKTFSRDQIRSIFSAQNIRSYPFVLLEISELFGFFNISEILRAVCYEHLREFSENIASNWLRRQIYHNKIMPIKPILEDHLILEYVKSDIRLNTHYSAKSSKKSNNPSIQGGPRNRGQKRTHNSALAAHNHVNKLPEITLRQLFEAGVHYGHQTKRWNPKMAPYIYGEHDGIHIFDLTQSIELLEEAMTVVRDTVRQGGRVLFVGTKRQAQAQIKDAAERSGQYYVNHRWLGGTLINWDTISVSINHLKNIDKILAGGAHGFTKRERLKLERTRSNLNGAVGGILEMGGAPDLMFVIDTNKEWLAVAEARKLGIPVVAIVDSNCDPDDVDYPIPGNDDSRRAIQLYCDLIAQTAIDGLFEQLGTTGIDLGAFDENIEELRDDDNYVYNQKESDDDW